jgi:hypothetical protein
MKQKLFFSFIIIFCSAIICSAQFIVKDETFSAGGVSNQGKVCGYGMQAGPYSIWLPDSGNVITDIGGIAPGNGVGGQARFSTDGNLICGTSIGAEGAEMSMYNRNANQWTKLGFLGYQIDGTVSAGFTISGDGHSVAGNSWADTTGGFAYTHAVVWNQEEGLLDLGSLFSNQGSSTRANAINEDGNVVVGWQDFNGPWKSAVWRKNPLGGYYPNEYILIDTAGDLNDEYNQMGECSSISADGKWIGGYGDYANNYQPWIWNKDSGVINLGTLPLSGSGFVSGMSADASVVVGWFNGEFFGDPQVPFIWTKKDGIQELNYYINNVLGYPTGAHQVYTADCISPDAHYIAGYGVDNSTFSYFVYRVSLTNNTGIKEVVENNLSIYPNPTSDFIKIECKEKSSLTISTTQGKLLRKINIIGTYNLDVSQYPKGIYIVSLKSGENISTQKIMKQ